MPRKSPSPNGPEPVLEATPSLPFRISDDQVEEWLVTGEKEDLLRRYFGAERYLEMQDLARRAQARSVRGGPRVLLLPGIMGSKIGSPRPFFFDDVIWLDPVDIAQGKLTTLACLPGPVRHGAVGVILFAYLKLKLELKFAGFDVDFHPYDWRRGLRELGRELVTKIEKEKTGEIHLVAHSMGGLVSRAAIAQGAKVRQLIMLGTPNYGSFAPVQALRAVYPVIRKVALIDVHHNPEQLTERVFSTFLGLYQMLPAREKFTDLDLFDISAWPAEGPRPRPTLLAEARDTQALLASPDERFFLVAGINQKTTVGVRREANQFVYTNSMAGDGTVPLAFAQLPGVPTYFVEESHGSLPNNGKVADAVRDLLRTSRTSALPDRWSVPRGEAEPESEEELRLAVPHTRETVRGAAVSDEATRHLMEELAAPPDVERTARLARAVPEVSVANEVMVSRRRQRRLEICFACGGITEVTSQSYVLGVFRDVMPTGAAVSVDRQMDGAIAEVVRRRLAPMNAGEVLILPTGCHPLRTEMVLMAGLGAFDQFNGETLELVAENVIRTFILTGVYDFATVLIGGSSGRDMAEVLSRLIGGFLRGLKDADQGQLFRRVTLCEVDPERCQAVQAEMYRLAGTELFDDVEVVFSQIPLPPTPPAPVSARGLPVLERAPVYLLVRREDQAQGDEQELLFRSSLLTAGKKATVITELKAVSEAKLNQHLQRIEASGFSFNTVPEFGQRLGELVLGDSILKVLRTLQKLPWVVVHDLEASRIPWETLAIGGEAPAIHEGLSRLYLAENLSVAKWLEERQRDQLLRVLLIVNPTRDLDGAEKEGERIRRLLVDRLGVQIVERRGSEASKAVLLTDFRSGQYDVVHYAGHAEFHPNRPGRSGIRCAGGELLSGQDLAGLGRLPSLMFFNACEAGRLRSTYQRDAEPRDIRQRIDRNVGLAEAFLRGGVANYIGTYWPVGDAPALKFAEVFYTRVITGATLGEALVAGRQAVYELKSPDWADYILFGSPDFVLKLVARRRAAEGREDSAGGSVPKGAHEPTAE